MRTSWLICSFIAAAGCATTQSSAPAPATEMPHDGMVLSHATAETSRCFANVENGTVCPVTGAALPFDDGEAEASLAAQRLRAPPCDEAAGAQCPVGQSVAEDTK